MAELITFKVNSIVKGPYGERLTAGTFVTYPDSPYLRIMLKSGLVELVDPPSLDYIDKPEILEAPKPVVEAVEVVEEPKVEAPKEEPKKAVKPSKTALFGAVEDKLAKLEAVSEKPSEDEGDESSE